MGSISNISNNQIDWINIISPGESELDFLREQYGFHPVNLDDSHSNVRSQRPKIDEHVDYLFLVIHFPIYDIETRKIKPAEVDFFIGHDFIITIHNNELPALDKFQKLCAELDHERHKHIHTNPSVVLYEILDRLLDDVFPLMDQLGEDIEAVEDNIFKGNEKEMVREILLTKQNITYFRKIMQSHKNVIKKLIAIDSRFFPQVDMKTYYNKLIEEAKDIWEILNTQKETIDAIHQTNESSLSFKLNDIMKTLTIFSVVVFPLTLVAAIFGMNSDHLPIVGQPGDFYIIMGIMFGMTLLMFIFFKTKKWI